MKVKLRARPGARAAILAEALKLFASRGVEAVSVRDIAAASGFSNPALFRHFASKEALARTLFENAYRDIAAALCDPSAQLGLRSWLKVVIGEIERAPAGAHFVFSNLPVYWSQMPGDLRGRNLPRLISEALERFRADGWVREDLDILAGGLVLRAVLENAARAACFPEEGLQTRALEARTNALGDVLLHGLGAKPAARRS